MVGQINLQAIGRRLTIMRFWKVTPRSLSGLKSLGIGEPLGWGSVAVPDGGYCAGV